MNIQKEIWMWAHKLPVWQQDIIRRLFAKQEIDDSEMDQIFNIVLKEHGINDPTSHADKPIPLASENIPVTSSGEHAVKIRALHSLENIGNVSDDQRIDFEPSGITIVYGENAAGKSTYARILKQSCRAIDGTVKIYPNVFATINHNTVKGKATIDIEEKGTVHAIDREVNTPPISPLSSFSIFDAKCACLYTDGGNTVTYVPSFLTMFERLAKVQNQLKDKIQDCIKTIHNETPKLPEFKEDSQVKNIMASLSHKTKPEDIKKMATLIDIDRVHLRELEKKNATLIANDPVKLASEFRRKASEAETLKGEVEIVAEALSNESIAKLREVDQNCVALQKAALIASQETFIDEPLKGVGSETWRALWNAARDFCQAEAYPSFEFPVVEQTDARCLLCHQNLSKDAKNRMKRFHAFITNKTELDAKKADDLRADIIKRLDELPLNKIEDAPIRKYFDEERPELGTAITIFEGSVKKLLTTVKNALVVHEWGDMPLLSSNPKELLVQWINDTNAAALDKDKLAKPEQQNMIAKELTELQARVQLEKSCDDVLKVISAKVDEDLLLKVLKSLDTSKITIMAGKLNEKVVTEGLKQRIASELKALRYDHMRIKTDSRGIKGKTHVKANIEAKVTCKVSEVLSEGEQKALALAFFLAEVGADGHNGGMILDDPVTSLDHRCREYVAKRLVEEARKRQVIIFTHDIVFLHSLQSYAKNEQIPCAAITVRRIADSSGIVKGTLPWDAQNVKARKGVLRDTLQTLEKQERNADPDEYRMKVKSWYGSLRDSWERAVEELLFNNVVQRFTPSIQTQRLKKVKVDDELIEEVEKGMTKSSKWVHDQAAGLNPPTPSSTELMADFQMFIEFIGKFGIK